MILNEVITCFFISFSMNNYLTSVSFSIENNFTTVSNLTYEIDNFTVNDIKMFRCSKYDKNNALLCYNKNNRESGCFIYNSNNYSLSNQLFVLNDCETEIYSSNLYYYEFTQEFIFSCESGTKNLYIIKIYKDFKYQEENNLKTYYFDNCNKQYGFSIIYINKLNIYTAFIIMNYNNKLSAASFLLTNNDLNCDNYTKIINQTKYIEYDESNNDKENSSKR